MEDKSTDNICKSCNNCCNDSKYEVFSIQDQTGFDVFLLDSKNHIIDNHRFNKPTKPKGKN